MKDLVSNIIALSEEFRVNAEKNVTGNKSAGVRARKISLEFVRAIEGVSQGVR